MRQLANLITATRFVFALLILWVKLFSAPFWVLYICGALSDMLDGLAARALHQQSEAGARLDSIADLAFAFAVLLAIVRYVMLPIWLWVCAGAILLVRLASYIVGYVKFHRFAPLHTLLNKASGALLFILPAFYVLHWESFANMAVCVLSLIAALEELCIVLCAPSSDPDCKGIFVRRL